MNADLQEVPVFKSGDPDAFVKAVDLLQAARIPFRVIDRVEGGDIPHTIRWILVPEASADEALLVIADVASEIPLAFSEPGEFWPRMVWVQVGWVLILLLLILIAVASIILVIQAIMTV